MKPIKLTIEGINSFTDEQTLDFQAAGRDNLFCISGKTGAGKSTIFDSILLALYGKCGRGNLGDVVNLSRKDARITFEFEADGENYLVERKITRTKKKDAKTEKIEIIADAAEEENGEDAAQDGDAQKVGDGKKPEKNLPLSTGTGKCKLYKNGEPFEVGNESAALGDIVGLTLEEFKNVYLLEQGEYAEFLKLTPQKQLETVGKIFSLKRFADVFSLAHAEQLGAESEIRVCDAKIESIGENAPAELKAVKSELAQLRAKNTALDKEISRVRAELEEESRKRDAYNSAMEKAKHVKDLALKLDDARRAQAAAESACREFGDDGKAARLAASLRERVTELSALRALDEECARLRGEEKQKRELYEQKRAEAARLSAAHESRTADVDSSDKRALAAIGEFESIARALENRSAAVESALAELCGDTSVSAAKITEAGHALKDELKDCNALAASRRDEAAARDKYAKDCDDALKKIESYTAAKTVAVAAREAAEISERDAAAKLAQAQTGAHAAAVRSELKAGDRCPVCGGVYGGCDLTDCGDVDRAKTEHAAAKEKLDGAVAEENRIARALDGEKAAFDRADFERKARDAKIAELDEKLRGGGVVPSVYETLLNVLRTALEHAKKAEELRGAAAAALPEIARVTAERDGAAGAADECAQKAANTGKELGDRLGRTAELMAAARSELDEAEARVKKLDAERAELAAKAEGEKARAATFESELAAAQNDCPVDMPEFDEEKYIDKKTRFDGMTAEFNEREKEFAVKSSTADMLAQKCDEIKTVDAERKEFVKRHDVYKKIADVTKGKALLNFVAEEYVYDFTAAASETLGELSGGKYSMTFDSVNGFLVYDYLNEGKARKASTLSGGEMFLASLAVAIAIADAQSKGDNAFFFLDEGFGTLDEELIDTVFGALSQLSAHCLVGVITHAGALIERMPCTVEVLEATDSVGSRINS